MLKVILFNLLKSYLVDTLFKEVKTHLNFSMENGLAFNAHKITTIRLGHKKIKPGPITVLIDGQPNDDLKLDVQFTFKKRFKDLTQADAVLDGFDSVAALKAELETCYGREIKPADKITQVFLKVVNDHAK